MDSNRGWKVLQAKLPGMLWAGKEQATCPFQEHTGGVGEARSSLVGDITLSCFNLELVER